jgi:tRNA(Ile)-lysidine synthase TilS/MesJ
MNINNSLFGKLVEGYNNIKLLCSGGVDSISGTHYLMTRNILLDKNVSVVHINHKLRKQNDDMEASVRKFCLDNNFPLDVYTVDGSADDTENDLRQKRLSIYRLFDRCCIVSFHHLNDCVESHFLNFIRGRQSIPPIPLYSPISDSENIKIHPFILNPKRTLVQYAQRRYLMDYVVEDETNKITKGSRRNLIRNEIIPILEQHEVGMESVVHRLITNRVDEILNDYSRNRNLFVS